MENEISLTFNSNDDFNIEYADVQRTKNIAFATEEYCETKCDYFTTCCANRDVCLKKLFEDILETLTPREEDVLKLSFGYDDNIKSLEEIAIKYEIPEDRVWQIQAKALRKMRHPSRSKKIKPFLFDIFSVQVENFYTGLTTQIFGIEEADLLEFKLGIDFDIVDKEKNSNKSPTQIKKELCSPIKDVKELQPFSTFLANRGITTLNQLLRSSEQQLSSIAFENSDTLLFDILKKTDDMGYRFKFYSFGTTIQEAFCEKIKEIISDTSIYCEQVLDLPLATTFKLLEYKISSVGDLVDRIVNLKSTHALKLEMQQEIDSFLITKNLVITFDDSTLFYLSKYNVDAFTVRLIDWMLQNGYSVNELLLDLKASNLRFLEAVKYICKKFPLFVEQIKHEFKIGLIDDLDFSIRTYNCLRRAGIHTIDDLLKLSDDDLGRVRNLGRGCIEEIYRTLSVYGLLGDSNLTNNEEAE